MTFLFYFFPQSTAPPSCYIEPSDSALCSVQRASEFIAFQITTLSETSLTNAFPSRRLLNCP